MSAPLLKGLVLVEKCSLNTDPTLPHPSPKLLFHSGPCPGAPVCHFGDPFHKGDYIEKILFTRVAAKRHPFHKGDPFHKGGIFSLAAD